MNIAICDDDTHIVAQLEGLASSCFDDGRCHIDVFYSGEGLIKALKNNEAAYQIYLLDVEMGKATGFDVAAEIRKRDTTAAVIFITSHSELMQEAFEVSAFHYLIKPVDEEKARQVILRAIESLRMKNAIFSFVVQKAVHTVYLEEIAYFESLGRKILIHMADGTVHEYYGTLKNVAAAVPAELFCQTHNSYIVNMEQVRHMGAESLTLHQGSDVPVSKKFHKDFNMAYHNFILTRTG